MSASPLLFLTRFLRNPRSVGALFPSGRRLAAAMLRDLDLPPDALVLEYGPGTGAFTAAIERTLLEDGRHRYLGIEREPAFCEHLRRTHPLLSFAQGSVEDVRTMLAERDLPAPQAILSGLPLILLPTMAEIVATAYEVLAPGGTFRTFTYLQSRVTPAAGELRRLMRARFDRFEQSPLVLGNLPPAWVLRGDKAN